MLDGISKELPGLNQGEILPKALFRARRFNEVLGYYARPEANGGRTALHVAAIAVDRGSAEALSGAGHFFPEEHTAEKSDDSRAPICWWSVNTPKQRTCMPKAVHATPCPRRISGCSGNRIAWQSSGFQKTAVSAMQHHILSLCDPQRKFKYPKLLVPKWREIVFSAQRNSLLTMLPP